MPFESRSLVVPGRPQVSDLSRWSRRALVGAGIAASLSVLARLTLGKAGVTAGGLGFEGKLLPRVLDASRALVEGRIAQADWQTVVEKVFQDARPSNVAQELGLDALLAHEPEARPIRGAANVHLAPPWAFDAGDAKTKPDLQAVAGFGLKLLVFRAGRANPPHGHDNIAALTYVMRGRFRVRHYDRIRADGDGILLKPTVDRILQPGDATSVSDMRDNVHWHEAETDGVLLAVYCKDLGGLSSRQVMVDPVNARDAGGGLLYAPLLRSLGEALLRFG